MLQVQKISKMFGGLKAVDQVSFDIKKGSIKAHRPERSGENHHVQHHIGEFCPDGGSSDF